jgi:hypothetical protein
VYLDTILIGGSFREQLHPTENILTIPKGPPKAEPGKMLTFSEEPTCLGVFCGEGQQQFTRNRKIKFSQS